jgi:hypothetical protein
MDMESMSQETIMEEDEENDHLPKLKIKKLGVTTGTKLTSI